MSLDDIGVTTVISVVLKQNRTGYRRTDIIINALVVYSLANGALTTLLTLLTLVLFLVHPTSWAWMAVFIVQERLYVNSLLASLNMRFAVQEESRRIDLSVIKFDHGPPPTHGTTSTQQTATAPEVELRANDIGTVYANPLPTVKRPGDRHQRSNVELPVNQGDASTSTQWA